MMSVAGQWDAVNGEVPQCPTVLASTDHDHQLERYMISDVKPVKILLEQLRPSTTSLFGNTKRTNPTMSTSRIFLIIHTLP